MDRKTFYIRLIPVVVTIVVGAFAFSGNMITYYCSPASMFLGMNLSKNPYCPAFVSLIHIILGSAFLLGVVFFVDSGNLSRKNLITWTRKPDRRKIRVTDDHVGNEIKLRIYNYEFRKPYITITQAEIFHQDRRSRISGDSPKDVKYRNFAESVFIQTYEKKVGFSIQEHYDRGEIGQSPLFEYGKYKFELAITYDVPQLMQGAVAWFEIFVEYTTSGIKTKIQNSSK